MSIHESGQDYLETILMLRGEKGVVYSIDIAERLGYSKASIRLSYITESSSLGKQFKR